MSWRGRGSPPPARGVPTHGEHTPHLQRPYLDGQNPRERRTFDPDGAYIRRYVPELRGITGPLVHEPWRLPEGPPAGYPRPIVDHATGRRVALDRYAAVSAGR